MSRLVGLALVVGTLVGCSSQYQASLNLSFDGAENGNFKASNGTHVASPGGPGAIA